MAQNVVIRSKSRSLPAALRQYENFSKRAVIAALNRTAQSGATVAIRAIQIDTGARKQKTIRDAVRVYKAAQNQAAPVAEIATKGKKIPLIEFRTTPSSPPKRRPRTAGVAWGPLRRLVPHSFIARMASGHVGVFRRIGEKVKATRGRFAGTNTLRQPIIELTGPSIPQVFRNRSVQSQVMAKIKERLPIELARAARHFTGRA